jgi:two-component system cell cycle sensor histidine kinase/response regulator CckA
MLSRPLEVAFDPRGIHTCLANLVANAFDACEYAETGQRRTSVAVKTKQNEIVFEVTDTGCGMRPEVRDRVLSDVFTTKGAKGSGLGLLMTRKIVEDHGGVVEIESVENRGTTVTIRIPCAAAQKEESTGEQVEKNSTKYRTGEGTMTKKILVIDDERDVNNFLTRLLTDNGYSVESAFNVSEAMRLIEEKEIDLMLLDLQMPGETGTDLYRKLRHKKKIPTIVVSGVAGRNLAVGREVSVLGKPIDEEKLLSEVRAHIGEA